MRKARAQSALLIARHARATASVLAAVQGLPSLPDIPRVTVLGARCLASPAQASLLIVHHVTVAATSGSTPNAGIKLVSFLDLS
jgi:hypothetical protein